METSKKAYITLGNFDVNNDKCCLFTSSEQTNYCSIGSKRNMSRFR